MHCLFYRLWIQQKAKRSPGRVKRTSIQNSAAAAKMAGKDYPGSVLWESKFPSLAINAKIKKRCILSQASYFHNHLQITVLADVREPPPMIQLILLPSGTCAAEAPESGWQHHAQLRTEAPPTRTRQNILAMRCEAETASGAQIIFVTQTVKIESSYDTCNIVHVKLMCIYLYSSLFLI